MTNISLNINTTKMVTLTVFFFLCSVLLLSQAPQPPKGTLTETSYLEEILTEAALNNPGLKAAFHEWKAALEKVPQVRALPDPQLTFAYFIQEIETRVGPQQQKIGIMQMFPWFGKRKLMGSAAAEAANAAKELYQAVKLDLFYRVKETYYDYYYAVKTVSILEENVRLLKDLEEVIRSRYRTGSAQFSGLVKIQVELDKLADRLKSAKEVLHPLQTRLNALINRPFNAPLSVPGEIPANTPRLSHEHLVSLLKQHNPILRAGDAMTAKEQNGIKLAKKNYYPDFSIGVDYMLTGKSDMPGVADNGKDPIAAMISLRLPIHTKKNKAAVNEAHARYNSAMNRQKENENNLLARLDMILFKYRDAQRKMLLYSDSLLPRARQALEVTRSSFETGKAGFMDFIDSQRLLLTFELEYEEAKTLRAQRLAEIEMLTGNNLSDLTVKHTTDTKVLE